VILLDLMMPGMDAEAFLDSYRQQGSGQTPILLLSAAPGLDAHAARLGVSDSMAKPFEIDALCARLRQLVVLGQAASAVRRCTARVPRVYELPERVLVSRAAPRAACYFCYVRTVGIKPTRRRLVP
jgi:DNA-binding response OmpR family regulator